MNKKSAIILAVVLIIILIAVALALVLNAKPKESGTAIELSEGKSKTKTDSYEASILYNNDHYILNIFTSYIEDDFSFTYDGSKFLLDTSKAIFENAKKKEQGSDKSYSFKLESNTLYEFDFIPLEKEKLEFDKNIFINKK